MELFPLLQTPSSKTPSWEDLLGLPTVTMTQMQQEAGEGRAKSIFRSMRWGWGDPPDVAQTPTFLTSNCGLTCSDRWRTCPQSTPPYTAVPRTMMRANVNERTSPAPPGIQAEIQSHCLHWSMFNSVEPGFMFLLLASAGEMILSW